MKRYILIICFLVPILVIGQNPFNKLIGWSDDDVATSIIINSDSNYVLTTVLTYNSNVLPSIITLNQSFDSLNSYSFSSKFWAAGYKEYYSSCYVSTGMWWANSSANSDINMFIRKIDKAGNIIYNRTYGGQDFDIGLDIEVLPDSGFMIVGSTESYGAGTKDLYVVRTNKNGDSLWTRTYGDNKEQEAYGVERENDSVYVVAGTWLNSITNSVDIFIMKIDLDGDTLMFNMNATNTVGERCYSLCRTSDDGYMVAGSKTIYLGTHYSLMFYMEKYDNNLNILWSKYYGYSGHDEAQEIKECFDHGFIMVGYSNQLYNGEDVYVVRTDSVGDTLWTRTFGGAYNDRANSVVQTPDGGFAIVGSTSSFGAGGSDGFFLKLKPNGDLTTSFGLAPEFKDLGLKVFPNPTSDFVSISSTNNEVLPSGIIQIYDVQGKLVKEVEIPNNQFSLQLNVQDLSKGIYFIKLNGSELNGASKLIIE